MSHVAPLTSSQVHRVAAKWEREKNWTPLCLVLFCNPPGIDAAFPNERKRERLNIWQPRTSFPFTGHSDSRQSCLFLAHRDLSALCVCVRACVCPPALSGSTDEDQCMTRHHTVVMGTFVIALTFSHGICHAALKGHWEGKPNLFLEPKQQSVCFPQKEKEKKGATGLS